MPVVHHQEHPDDKRVMATLREMLALQGERPFGPAARPGFDAMMARTPQAEGIAYEAGEVGSVPGWWCRPAAASSDGVILHLHGGAYVMGSAGGYRNYVGQLAARAGWAAFTADYALAPEHPFPAAANDAFSVYMGLAAAGHRRIVLAGDSAGGGLALALLAKVNRAADLPRPLGALAVSPWTDLTLSGASIETRAQADPLLTRDVLAKAAGFYLGDHDSHDPGASPLFGNVKDLPPIFLHVGEDEILRDDAVRYAERVEVSGGRATVHVWQGMPHVFPASVDVFRAAAESLSLAAKFIQGL